MRRNMYVLGLELVSAVQWQCSPDSFRECQAFIGVTDYFKIAAEWKVNNKQIFVDGSPDLVANCGDWIVKINDTFKVVGNDDFSKHYLPYTATTKFMLEHTLEQCEQIVQNAPAGKNYFHTKDKTYWAKSICGSNWDVCCYSLSKLIIAQKLKDAQCQP